nr:hypothetical protein [Pyrobaculum sp.]
MIALAVLGGLAAARRLGPGWGVLAMYLLYLAYGAHPLLFWAGLAGLLALGRGLFWDRQTALAFALAFGKFLLVPFLLGRLLPYYEALWYALRASPAWASYAPLTYLPQAPPLELALGGTLFVVSAAALGGRALAEVWGRGAVLWPLLATQPLWFGQWGMAAPLVWASAYFAAKGSWAGVLASLALASGLHIYGGILAAAAAFLWGARWVVLLAPALFLLPQSWILWALARSLAGSDLASRVALLFSASPWWLAKTAVEGAVLIAAAFYAGRMGVLALLGLVASILLASSRPDFGGYAYRHFLAALPFASAGMGRRLLAGLGAASLAPFFAQVWLFGLSADWALYYASTGDLGAGPVAEAYRAAYSP